MDTERDTTTSCDCQSINLTRTYKYGVFFFQILYSESMRRSSSTSATSFVEVAAAGGPVLALASDDPVMIMRRGCYR